MRDISIYKRTKGSPFFWYDFTIDGNRFRGSTKTKAREEAKLIAEAAYDEEKRKARLGVPSTVSLNVALGRYWLEHACDLPSAGTIKIQSGHLQRIIGATRTLDKINTAVVSDYMARRRGEKIRRGHGKAGTKFGERLVSASTVNREVRSCLRSVMTMAAKRWGYSVGAVDWTVLKNPEPEGRQRYLSAEQARAVIDAAATHAKPAIATALHTGLRLSNVMRLGWGQVDLPNRQITVKVKSRKPGGKTLRIPVSVPLLNVLLKLSPKDEGPVFTYTARKEGGVPKPVKKMRRAFATALKKVGITDFHWHDLRHTAASLMLDGGVPLDVVQDMLGHADPRQTKRYAHRPPAALRNAADKLGDVLSSGGTNTAQPVLIKEVS